ncbi:MULTISPECIES: thioredoxin domain-containing protein [Halorussus]|uniref:thioredoxin domain-containing protein n=1 Tax=Halorussus TaxID=1070314 RepID=UPI000E21891C|nr:MULTISPECIES: thioredoxin domain-containing protein [Halorussus]NHN58224.1 thioredoxin [Halorussus sp. JP-T4]
MTRRESDTSASDAPDEAADPAPIGDPEALFDLLVEEGVLAVGDDGEVGPTDAFEDTQAIYHDSYLGVGETEFHEAVASTFGLPDADAAADLVGERGIDRGEFVCYLAVRSHLDRRVAADDLTTMAGMVWEAVPDSPVPPAVEDVTDDPEAFLAGRDRAVVSVWKRFCDPCDALKADLDAVLSAVPDGVDVAGVDGEIAGEFCRTHGVEAAPRFVAIDGSDTRVIDETDADGAAAALRGFFGA